MDQLKSTNLDLTVFTSILKNVSNSTHGVAIIQLATLCIQQSLAIEYLIKALHDAEILTAQEASEYIVTNSTILAQQLVDKIKETEENESLDAAVDHYIKNGGKVYEA